MNQVWPFKGAVSRYSVIFCTLFARAKYGHCSRKCHGYQLGQPREQLHRPSWVEQLSFSAAWPGGRHYFSPHKMAAKNHRLSWHCRFKGSVERSLLSRAIFLIFTQNKPWKSEDHRCTLFFIEMSKERLEKSERTPPVSWRPWALAYSRDRPYNFSYLSAVSKNRLLAVFSRLWGVIWRGKAFLDQQCQFLTRNKSLSSENESNCLMTSECVRTDSILPPRRRPRARSM